MTPDQIEDLFTRSGRDGAVGDYVFARWGRPIVPVIFGVEEATVSVFKGAIEALVTLAGHQMAETDPELGANLMIFFVRDWEELSDTPNMDHLIPDLAKTVDRLNAAGASQYRAFRFDDENAIQACFAFVRMEGELEAMPAETIALSVVVQAMLLWSDRAFASASPLASLPNGTTVLKPDISGVIVAAYDPVLPVAARDKSHALRLAARMGRMH